jgi:hypothetical protein
MKSLIFLSFLIVNFFAFSRPEYASRAKINNCSTCHVSVTGGGHRTITGKAFGARGYSPSDLAGDDTYGLDVRGLFFHNMGKKNAQNKPQGGLGLMAALISAQAPIYKSENYTTTVAGTYNVLGFAPGPRELYFKWQKEQESHFNSVMFGHFMLPFGVMTDEHRTYTRKMTNTSWSTVQDVGVMVSGDLSNWHYDLALVNSPKNSAGVVSTKDLSQMGANFNLRWTLNDWPLTLGLSQNFYAANGKGANSSTKNSAATSAYAIIPVSLSEKSLDFIFEYTYSDPYSISGGSPNVMSTTVLNTLIANDDRISTMLFRVNYDLMTNFIVFYKFDGMVADSKHFEDLYSNHGVGFKHWFAPSMYYSVRYDKQIAGHPTDKKDKAYNTDSIYALLTLGF